VNALGPILRIFSFVLVVLIVPTPSVAATPNRDPTPHVDLAEHASGEARPASWQPGLLTWHRPHKAVAPGQSVVLYDTADPDRCLGGAPAA